MYTDTYVALGMNTFNMYINGYIDFSDMYVHASNGARLYIRSYVDQCACIYLYKYTTTVLLIGLVSLQSIKKAYKARGSAKPHVSQWNVEVDSRKCQKICLSHSINVPDTPTVTRRCSKEVS